jgi:uncharacterized protein
MWIVPGDPALFVLPDDEEEALETTQFLLAHGADRTITNKDGRTAEQVARQRGLIEAADLMHADDGGRVGNS